VNSGAAYTLNLFSGSESDDIIMQLAPDGGKGSSEQSTSVRLIEASNATGPVGLSVTSMDTGERTVLADGVGYGLVTGYASLPGGDYTVSVSAGGGDWQRSIELPSGKPVSLLLTDSEGGPSLVTLSDTPADAVALLPPTLAVPGDPATVAPIVAARPAGGHSAAWPVPLVLVAGIAIGALGMVARRRMGRQW
jgi:Tfp pilus tip-associated adhesin PilY1